MGVNSLPKTVTRQRRDCDLNPGHSAPDSSTLTTRLPSHPIIGVARIFDRGAGGGSCEFSKFTFYQRHYTQSLLIAYITVLLCRDTSKLRYDTRCYFNARSKADTETTTKKYKTQKVKTDVLRSNSKQSGESCSQS